MTDTSPLATTDSPSPPSSFSPSPASQLVRDIGAWVVALATIAAITVGWLRGRFDHAPWWAAPGALILAGMPAASRSKLIGTAVRRALPGKE